ncbi:hypothetical protein Ddc_23800 [Ditylenchus destructor]|nr:hypothetical protein Ddc_23800 [Ditylenchus destructor]
MHLLILGGTVFLGRHVIAAALSRGHTVTMLNRGRHGRDLFPEVERLIGDRGRRHERPSRPRVRRRHRLQRLHARADRAFARRARRRRAACGVRVVDLRLGRFVPGKAYDESTELAPGDEGYGALKARSEEALARALPDRHTLVRPGLIVGPHDPTGRFTYWPDRVARGGEVLAPGPGPSAPSSSSTCAISRTSALLSPSHAPSAPSTPSAIVCRCASCSTPARRPLRTAMRASAGFPDETLLALGVTPWTGLPLWLPESNPEYGGMLLADCSRAFAAGLTTRPMTTTIADTLAWSRAPREADWDGAKLVATITPQREAECLAAFRGGVGAGVGAGAGVKPA